MQHLNRGPRPGQPAIPDFLKQLIMKRTFASLESNQLQTACVDQSWGFCIWSGQAGKVVHKKCIHEGKLISFDSEKHHSVLNCTALFVRKRHVQWHPASTAQNDTWSGSVSLNVFLGQAAHSCWVTSYRSPTHSLHTQVLRPPGINMCLIAHLGLDHTAPLCANKQGCTRGHFCQTEEPRPLHRKN